MAFIKDYCLQIDTSDRHIEYVADSDGQICDEEDVKRRAADMRYWLSRGVKPIVTVFVPQNSWGKEG